MNGAFYALGVVSAGLGRTASPDTPASEATPLQRTVTASVIGYENR